MQRGGPALLALLLVVALCAIGLPIHAAQMPMPMGEVGALAGAADRFAGSAPEMPGVSPCCLAEALPATPAPALPLTAAVVLVLGLLLAWAPPAPLGRLPRADRWHPPGRRRFVLFHAYLI